jgi:hypothetical protein
MDAVNIKKMAGWALFAAFLSAGLIQTLFVNYNVDAIWLGSIRDITAGPLQRGDVFAMFAVYLYLKYKQ